jgi:F-box-like
MIFVPLTLSQTCDLIGLESNRQHSDSPIHILNDDVLLNIFYLYRLTYPDEYDGETGMAVIAWSRQRWWYRLAHVCRQWRSLILESPSRLDLHLYCTNGVPVADMLTHSPPLPLTIDYDAMHREMTAEDESGILLALSHRDRVRRIDLFKLPNLGKFVTAMDDRFLILERLYVNSRTEVVLPETFQAPNLRRLRLLTASLPIGSPLLTTATRLVTLTLLSIPASTYFPPSYILSRLSFMLQLERLVIEFCFPTPNRDVEYQLHQTPDITTLPNLRWFMFTGVSAYLEGLVARISAPSLSILHTNLFNQLPFTFPHLLQFMKTSENLRFTAVQVAFDAFSVSVCTVPWKWDTPLMLQIRCGHLDLQVASAAQLFDSLSPVLSVVEKVTFSYDELNRSSEWHNDADRSQWCELLRPFTNVKTIHVQDDLANKIFHSLPSDDGEPPLEVLPNLEEIGYSGGGDTRDAFTRFLNERQASGHPVSLHLVDRSMFDMPGDV